MPRFGGFNVGNIGGALARNAVGTIANAVLPRTAFGGFGLQDIGSFYPQQNAQDRRVSLRPKPAAENRVYGNGLLKPLKDAGGLIWPYTPSISYQHEIDYQNIQTVHANQDFHIYSKTPAVKLQVSGDFSVQNPQEGAYALAALHFFRTVAKMHFGETDPQAGVPPPVLLFNAYGPFVFKDVPVIVNSFTMEFPDGVDYVQVGVVGDIQTRTIPGVPAQAGGITGAGVITRADNLNYVGTRNVPVTSPPRVVGSVTTNAPTIAATPDRQEITGSQTYTVWLPSLFKLSCNIIVQHTSKELRQNFDLNKYRNGAQSQQRWV